MPSLQFPRSVKGWVDQKGVVRNGVTHRRHETNDAPECQG